MSVVTGVQFYIPIPTAAVTGILLFTALVSDHWRHLEYNIAILSEMQSTIHTIRIKPSCLCFQVLTVDNSSKSSLIMTYPYYEHEGLWRVCDSIEDSQRRTDPTLNRRTACLHYFGIKVDYFKKSSNADWEFEIVRSAEVCAIVSMATYITALLLAVFAMFRQQAISTMIAGVCCLASGVYTMFTSILMHLRINSLSPYDEVLTAIGNSGAIPVKTISVSWSCYLAWTVVFLQICLGSMWLWLAQKMAKIMHLLRLNFYPYGDYLVVLGTIFTVTSATVTASKMDDYRPAVVQIDDSEIALKKKNHLWKPDKKEALEHVGYTFHEMIGQGLFSKTKRSHSRKFNKVVAIKIVTKKKVPREYLDKFLCREIFLQQRLIHPHVTQLLEAIESSRFLYLVQEYAPNGDLLEYVNGKPKGHLSESEARRLFKQIVDAVTYLHAVGVVHRDLKLDNFLLDDDYNIKLTDFGFSRLENRTELCATFCGSYVYAAPEVLDGEPYDGYKADVWSLGVSLYCMVCGCMPFPDVDIAVLRAAMVDKISFLNNLSHECRSLLLSLLSAAPTQRPNVTEIKRFEWMKIEIKEGSDLVKLAPSSVTTLQTKATAHYHEGEHGFACGTKTKERRPSTVTEILQAVALKHCEENSSNLDLTDPASCLGVSGPAGRRVSIAVATEIGGVPTARRTSLALGKARKGSLFASNPKSPSGEPNEGATHRRLSIAAAGKTPLHSRRGSINISSDSKKNEGSLLTLNTVTEQLDDSNAENERNKTESELRNLKHSVAGKVATQACKEHRRSSIAHTRNTMLPFGGASIAVHTDPVVRSSLDKWKSKCQKIVDSIDVPVDDLRSGSWVIG